jgi:predicted transcriptional regulator
MNSWHSYSSIFNIGHKALSNLFDGPVYVEEKVDGSQFSFGLIETSEFEQSRGEEPFKLRVRSKGVEMVLDAPDKMFTKAVETVKSLKDLLHPGWTYRAEYLRAPKHNALIYNRIPKDHLIIFDIEIGECEFLEYPSKWMEAKRLGLEVVPLLWQGKIDSLEEFRDFLTTDSVLGGQKIEGVVIKPVGYGLFGKDKKVLMGKFVSEAFKEVHAHMWKADNPTVNDIVAALGASYGTQARWQKALQHLTEKGLITDAPQDIGLLMKEIPEDIKRECREEIMDKLFAFAWPHISRMVVRQVPEWYKELLLKKQFEREDSNEKTSVGQEASGQEAQGLHSGEQEASAADQSQA